MACPKKTNTLEGFNSPDKQSLLKAEATKIWDDILSGKAEENSSVLLRFLVISFADLEKWSFHYWFAFPALVIDARATLVSLGPATQRLSSEEAQSLSVACNAWRDLSSTTGTQMAETGIGMNRNMVAGRSCLKKFMWMTCKIKESYWICIFGGHRLFLSQLLNFNFNSVPKKTNTLEG